jgi:probable rRNA maturation factor
VDKGKIFFFTEEIKFNLPEKKNTKNWISTIVSNENKILGNLNFIFCSDKYLHDLNKKYLHHDTFTDIITFDYSETLNNISGDIYISIDRVKDNSVKYKCDFSKELYRVISHGVLHLIGYNDKITKDALIIRQKEDYYLSLLPNFILE